VTTKEKSRPGKGGSKTSSSLKTIPTGQDVPKRHVALYARVSSDHQAREGVSLEAQEHELREYARTHWPTETAVVYREEGVSAFKNPELTDRPQGKALCNEIAAGKVVALVAHAQDRLTRGRAPDWFGLVGFCHENGTELHTLQEGAVDETPIADLLGAARALIGYEKSATGSAKTRAAKEQLRREGLWGGKAPLGYKRGADRILYETEDAPAILEVFERFDAGASIRRVHELLCERTGRTFSKGTVNYVLRNPTYTGRIPFGVSGNRGRARQKVYEGKHEAIVSLDLFERVQLRLDENERADARHSRLNPFAGLARCKPCGQALRWKTTPRRNGGADDTYLLCENSDCGKTRIPAEHVTAAVMFGLASAHDEINVGLHDDPAFGVTRTDPRRANQLRKELNDLDQQKKNLISLIIRLPSEDDDTYDEEVKRVRTSRRALRAELTRLEAGEEALRRRLIQLRDSISSLGNLADWWRNADPQGRQEALASILEQIEVNPEPASYLESAAAHFEGSQISGRELRDWLTDAQPSPILDVMADHARTRQQFAEAALGTPDALAQGTVVLRFRAGIEVPFPLLLARRDKVRSPALRSVFGTGRKQEYPEVISPGTANTSRPSSSARSAVINAPLRSRASTTTTARASSAMIRFLAGKRQGAGSTPGGYSETTNPRSPIWRASDAWLAG
jgi:DNA invertase Pin-like site-specific DNA recombinase